MQQKGSVKMKIRIDFKLEKKEFNADWRRTVLSFLKHLLENEKLELYEKYYVTDKTGYKKFNFYAYLPGAKFEQNRIELKDAYVSIYISSTDISLLTYFFNAALKAKRENYPLKNGNSMQITKVILQKTKQIKDEEIVISMKSPLVVRQHTKGNPDKYYYWNEDKFQSTLQQNIKARYPNWKEYPKLEPIKCKTVVARAYGCKIPASLGIFKLTGNPEKLNELYLNGIGSRTSAGFGSFEVIS